MKTHSKIPEQTSHGMRAGFAHRLRTACVMMLVASLSAPSLPAAKAAVGAVPVFLPPFVGGTLAVPFLQQVSPFSVIGFIQGATLDPLCTAHPFCGGTVTVNGTTIVVPQNTVFQFPANTMTWDDMFANAPAAYKALGQSGMAMTDTPKPLTTYEVTVFGNRVINGASDQYIAGLIYLSQNSVQAHQGFINFINYTTGDIWVSQKLTAGPSGARLRINSPGGRYATPDPNADVRFSADEDNPTIATRNGYPMCLPRIDPKLGNDSLCPQWNRPRDPLTGAFSTNFTMQAATAGAVDAAGITHQVGYPSNQPVKPDPFEQVPLAIGDYITYSGTITQDAACLPGQPVSSCQYISAHTVSAELGIFTAPGTWPVYVMAGEYRIGVAGVPNPLFPQEGLEKFFGDMFTTDSTALLDIFASDVNPCTGARTNRFYGTADPFGPPVAGLKGRGRFRTNIGNFMPATREIALASRSLTHGAPLDNVLPTIRRTANGLKAGYYQAPDFAFIFAENLVLGSPQVPLTFQEFPFLVNGSGPYTRLADGVVFPPPSPAGVGGLGQLKPFPDLSPLPAACTIGQTLIQPPTSNAGSPQSVASGDLVTLSASGSVDGNVPPLPLIYTWVQSAGPAVVLNNPSLVSTQFVAPTLPTGSLAVPLTFQLVACNGFTCGGVSSVTVTVNPLTTGPSVTLSALPGLNIVNGSPVTLTGTVTGGTGPFTHRFVQIAGPAQALTTTANTATFRATLPAGTALPSILTFTDTVTGAGGLTATARISVFVGADTLTVTAIIYKLAKSTLSVTLNTNALPKGSAVITATPLGANGLPITAPVVVPYDPVADNYTIPVETWFVNPLPSAVRFNSSFGGTKISPILTIQ